MQRWLSKYGSCWGFIFKGVQQWEYRCKRIADFEIAKTVAFNLFDELHEFQYHAHPCWDGNRWIYI